MRINFSVEEGYEETIGVSEFQMDINPRDKISNLQVLITLRFPILDLKNFSLYCKGHHVNPKIADSLIRFKLKENDWM